MPDAPRPVIVNQLGPELGRVIEQHPSAPVIIEDPFPPNPGELHQQPISW